MRIGDDDLGVFVHKILERSDGVGPRSVAGKVIIGRRRRLVVVAADIADLDSEAVSVVIISLSGSQGLENVGVGDEDRRSAERTGLVRLEPSIDAESVEGVTADREEAELVGRLEFRKADSAIGAGDCRGGAASARDGGEGEERERVYARVRLRRDAATGDCSLRVSDAGGGGGVGGGGRRKG